MSSRKEYQTIADRLISSFTSRNNDVHGYWGIGKLYSFSQSVNTNKIVIDLIEKSITPQNNEFIPMIHHFAQKLNDFQQKREPPTSTLSDAKIFISSVKSQNIFTYDSWAPNELKCTIKFRCDTEKTYTKELVVKCRPHDPRRETKSMR